MRLREAMGCGRSKNGVAAHEDSDNKNNHDNKSKDPVQLKTGYTKAELARKYGPGGVDIASVHTHGTPPESGRTMHNGEVTHENSLDNNSSDNSQTQDKKPIRSAFKQGTLSSSPLQSSKVVTGSQVEFFKMLEEKIAAGTDYREDEDS